MASSSITEQHSVTSIGAAKALKAAFNVKRSVFLWGPPGIGKSELVKSIAEELGGVMIDLRMAQMEPTDIRGIPYYNSKENNMHWAPPVSLPTAAQAKKHPVMVLFLDELNSASPAVQAVGYQLILDRKIGEYELPENVVICAAGNRETDKGVTYRMPTPLANRFIHVEMRSDLSAWQKWAINNNINTDVIGFLSHNKGDLHDFDPKVATRAFPTPRSWTFVSDLVSQDDIDDDTLFTLIAGTVGEGLAHKFIAHRRVSAKMPHPMDILTGKVKDLNVKEISAMYSLVISMCYELRDAQVKKAPAKEMNSMVDNFLGYIMKNFETELVVLGSRIAIKEYKIDFDATVLKNFDEFPKKFGKYILDAIKS
jgi:hypothetical protein